MSKQAPATTLPDATTRHHATTQDPDTVHDDRPAGGWGSIAGLSHIVSETGLEPAAVKVLARLNKPEGVMCSSCAWAKPANPHAAEFCENGAKSVLWELDKARADRGFLRRPYARRTPDLERPRSGERRPAHRAHALRCGERHLQARQLGGGIRRDRPRTSRASDPKEAVFYASGHAGLEASYLYALFARAMGHQNLPQSSNMCHETTSVNLKSFIGTPVGTCTLEDFDHCDAIFFFGQNTGSNSPRFMHTLKAAVERGCRIATFNPLRERGLIEFTNPAEPAADDHRQADEAVGALLSTASRR